MKRILSLCTFLIICLFMFGTQDAHAQEAQLSIDPATQTVAATSTFQIIVRVDTGEQAINTVAANITYDADVVTPQSIDTTGSFITIWFEQEINTTGSVVQLSGSIPSPGINGEELLFATINFTANEAATTQLQFDEDSAIFRDSDNTNILSSTVGGIVTVSTDITPEASITSGEPTPDPTVDPSAITPTGLPDAGTTTQTFVLLIIAVILAAGAVILLM